MPTRAEMLNPRWRTIYRNDPMQIDRRLDPETGEMITQHEESPPIRSSLEPARLRSAALQSVLDRYTAPARRIEPLSPPPPGGENLGPGYQGFRPWSESFENVMERERRIGEESGQLPQLRAQTAGLEAETAVQRRSLEPVELPGLGPVEREAIPFLSAREGAREAERVRQTLTPYQGEQLGLARKREARLAGTGKEGISQAEARQLYGLILTEVRLRLGPAALPDEVAPMIKSVAEEMGVDLGELNTILSQGLTPLEPEQPNVGVSPVLRTPLAPAREAILGGAKAAVAGSPDREKLIRAQVGQTVTLTDGRKVKKVGANAFETVQ